MLSERPAADAMPWEALRKVRWSATSPGHLPARTRLDGAALVSMLRQRARGRWGLRIRRMARGPPRHRCLGRSTSRAGVARLPGRTERRSRSGEPWRNMLAGHGTEDLAGYVRDDRVNQACHDGTLRLRRHPWTRRGLRKAGIRRRGRCPTAAKTAAMSMVSYRRETTGVEYRPRRQPLLDSPGRLA